MKSVTVDQEECVGCGTCEAYAPDVFRMDPEGKAEVYGNVTEENEEKVQEAIDDCPVSAISWE